MSKVREDEKQATEDARALREARTVIESRALFAGEEYSSGREPEASLACLIALAVAPFSTLHNNHDTTDVGAMALSSIAADLKVLSAAKEVLSREDFDDAFQRLEYRATAAAELTHRIEAALFQRVKARASAARAVLAEIGLEDPPESNVVDLAEALLQRQLASEMHHRRPAAATTVDDEGGE